MPHDQPHSATDVEDASCPPDARTVPDGAGSPELTALEVPPGGQVGDTAPAPPSQPSPGFGSSGGDERAGCELEELVLPPLVRAPEPLAPGTEIGPQGRLRVVEHRAARGQVNLYRATWRQDDGAEIEVELREAPADHAGLRREAEILSGIRFAMLPRAYQAFANECRQYLALDRLDGASLEEASIGGLPPVQAVSIVLQLVQAVRRLHRDGWALLGLTPADIAVGQPVRIAQLGRAARIGERSPQALQVSGYSAPELAYAETVTGKEDVYTLGAILYRALTGHPAPDGDADDLSGAIRVPGIPQLLAGVLTPADDRLDLDALYRRLLDLNGRLVAVAVSLEVASATTVGLNPTRLVNEDASCYGVWARTDADGAGETALLCVADGMGGMEAGEVASRAAIDTVMSVAVATLWPAATDSTGASPRPRLDPAVLVRTAATAVHAAGQGRDLGTTITCVAVHDGDLSLAHVGDTRAYLLRDGALTRLTADHSLVAAMVASGVITAEEARGHPDSNKVLRSLGSQRELPPSYVDGLEAAFGAPSLRLTPGDVLLLCSDGVWGTVPDDTIQIILTEALDAQNAARALVDLALQGGAPDNATAVVARCVRRPAH